MYQNICKPLGTMVVKYTYMSIHTYHATIVPIEVLYILVDKVIQDFYFQQYYITQALVP